MSNEKRLLAVQELRRSTKRLETARRREQAAWAEQLTIIDTCYKLGVSQAEIARVVGVSKPRIWVILNRGKNEKAEKH